VIESRLCFDEEIIADRLLVIDGDGWHRGVIGILASRVVERTAKPALVISIEDSPDGRIAHGSGRSVDGFPLLAAIESCADLFTRFGGHAFAVGFALPADRLPEMERRLYEFAARKLAGKPAEQILHIHAELPIERVTPALAGWLRKLEPLGHGNPEPVFLARSLRLTAPVRKMKEKHIRLDLIPTAPAQELPHPSAPIQAVGWNLAHRAAHLRLDMGSVIDLAYRIRENDHPQYGGLQIEIAGLRLQEDKSKSTPSVPE
jgi:single-stranded-DNA-specific exonuclease